MTCYVSTRAHGSPLLPVPPSHQGPREPLPEAIPFSQAVQQGLAPDGGLFVPQIFPQIDPGPLAGKSFLDVASAIAQAFVGNDPLLKGMGPELCQRALDFPIPLISLSGGPHILELFHGPTAAFKDVGARFLGACISAIAQKQQKMRTVLVATSGDTGGAVASAFVGRPQTEVFVLYPRGRISSRQEKQLTCWGNNVTAIAIRGVFDDCQRLVKEAFLNPIWQKSKNLISANSINIGRILPQSFYYAWASLQFPKGTRPTFVVPSGNLGNAVSALWAQRMGFPIGHVHLACNANRPVPEFLASGQWAPQNTLATLANAMDVGNPSNMERLRHLLPDFSELTQRVSASSSSDSQIKSALLDAHRTHGQVLCPHTAAGWFAQKQVPLPPGEPVVLVATAHPAKFHEIVEDVVQKPVGVPQSLAQVLSLPNHFIPLEPDLRHLAAVAHVPAETPQV